MDMAFRFTEEDAERFLLSEYGAPDRAVSLQDIQDEIAEGNFTVDDFIATVHNAVRYGYELAQRD